MKTKIMIFCFAAMLLSMVQSTYGFYNPSTGRWLSRDPLAEKTFWKSYVKNLNDEERIDIETERTSFELNPYIFAWNSPSCAVDIDGARLTPKGDVPITKANRRDPPKGMELVTVDKCNIQIIYGHNYVNNFTKKGLQWIWNIVPAKDTQPAQSAYAAVIGCNAYLVPNEIPLPGYVPVVGLIEVKNAAEDTDLARELNKAFEAAKKQAKEICKLKCGCNKIKIRSSWYGLNFEEKMTWPSLPSEDVDCKGVK